MASNLSEIESIRAAHTKCLEMLISYQQENDSLRSEMNKMSEQMEAMGTLIKAPPPPSSPPVVSSPASQIGGSGTKSVDTAEQTF